MYFRMPRTLGLLAACALIAGCHASAKYRRITLTAGSPADVTAGLRLIAVDADGTAHIEWPAVGWVSALRPNTATNMISMWTLDSADPAKQQVRISTELQPPIGFRYWPFDPIKVFKGDGRDFTPQELVKIARTRAVKERVTTVDFTNACPIICAFNAKSPVLAQVHWSGGLGQPCLTVEIDRRGNVSSHRVAIAACGGVIDATRR